MNLEQKMKGVSSASNNGISFILFFFKKNPECWLARNGLITSLAESVKWNFTPAQNSFSILPMLSSHHCWCNRSKSSSVFLLSFQRSSLLITLPWQTEEYNFSFLFIVYWFFILFYLFCRICGSKTLWKKERIVNAYWLAVSQSDFTGKIYGKYFLVQFFFLQHIYLFS